jgi:transposase
MTKRYSEQFKQESIQYVQSHPESGIATIAKQLGVGYSTLDSWLRHHRKSMGVAKSALMSDDQQCIRQLEKQVSHLTEVNEILKKAHVYFINNPSR